MRNIIYRILGESSFDKGILAADESSPTIQKRFDSVGVDSTPSTRHKYRHALFSTDKLEDYIGGVILFDETIRNEETIAPLKEKGICLGIKVDKGAKPYDEIGGMLTEGLDGLAERLREYRSLGAEFAKWRAVIAIDDTDACIIANAWTLARYAKRCQDEGIVPIVEPEVIMDGCPHHIVHAQNCTNKVLHHVFDAMYYEHVELESMILKPNMVLHGSHSGPLPQTIDTARNLTDSEIVANYTLECFYRCVPSAVPMIAFLSGGQPDGEAVTNLNAMNRPVNAPWPLSFSFGRELQQNSLKLWAEGEIELAKEALLARALECSRATQGDLYEFSGV